MQFNIDAKEQYTVITPQKDIINANMAAKLAEQCGILSETGSKNFIIDLKECQDVGTDFLIPFVELSASYYEQENSFVITNPPAEMLRIIKEEDAIDSLNTAPTFIEAVDIISMEILERDLFNEE